MADPGVTEPLLDRRGLVANDAELGPGTGPATGVTAAHSIESEDEAEFEEKLEVAEDSKFIRPSHRVPSVHSLVPEEEEKTFWPTTLNVTKVILGAGMMVIPHAFQMVGVIVAVTFLLLVGTMTWFTISGLLYAADKTGQRSYASVMRHCCGKPAKWGLIFAVFFNCFGMCAVFLVIFADILVGTAPDYNGILNELLPDLPLPDAWACWILDRHVVVAVLVVVLLLPLVLQPSLSKFDVVNAVGVASIIAFALSTMVLAGAAWSQGVAGSIQWLPDWEALGSRWPSVVASLANVVPIIMNANIFHQALFPATTLLKPYSRRDMNKVVGLALTICNVLYTIIAVSCIVAFGPKLESDVLSNLGQDAISPLVGRLGAGLIAHMVRVGYLVSLVGSFVLMFHPLRQCVLEVTLRSRYHRYLREVAEGTATSTTPPLFYPTSLGLMLAAYLAAVYVPDIWVMLGLVGSAAANLMGFIFPAAVILVLQKKPKWQQKAHRAAAWAVLVLGSVLFVNGFLVFIV